MSQPQTVQITNHGTSKISSSDLANKTTTTDVIDTVSKFDVAIHKAIQSGQQYVETSKDVIEAITPSGLGSIGYIIYKNVRVYEHGTAEKLLSEENTPDYLKNGGLKILGR